MDEFKTDEEDILKNQQEETPEAEIDDEPVDDVDDLKQRLQKAEELARNQKIRAEKAELKFKTTEKTAPTDRLSTLDLIALSRADVDEDTLSEVMDYAKYKKMSIAEALKSPLIKATLADRKETKRVADATNTGSARRGTSKTSDYSLLENARNGNMPDSVEDINRLIELRRKK